MKLNYVEKWWSEYRGVRFEINRNTMDCDGTKFFTFYILLHKEKMSKEMLSRLSIKKKTFRGHGFYPTSNVDIGFHGGCTFYDKEKYGLRIGCDYNHLHDNEMHYTLEDIVSDAKECIDALLLKFPNYKRWCGNCGVVTDIFNGKISEVDEGCYSFKCIECVKKAEVNRG